MMRGVIFFPQLLSMYSFLSLLPCRVRTDFPEILEVINISSAVATMLYLVYMEVAFVLDI
jgi:hypothetical protein